MTHAHSSTHENLFSIVHKGVQAPSLPPCFLRHPPFDPACPLPFFKSLFRHPSFLFHPHLRYFPQTVPPTLTLRSLING